MHESFVNQGIMQSNRGNYGRQKSTDTTTEWKCLL